MIEAELEGSDATIDLYFNTETCHVIQIADVYGDNSMQSAQKCKKPSKLNFNNRFITSLIFFFLILAYFNLSLSSSPVFVDNANGFLKCVVPNINPLHVVSINWFKDDTHINSATVSNDKYANQTLHFNKLSQNNTGNYHCSVSLKNRQIISSNLFPITVYKGNKKYKFS